jgi:hypothetical protein
MDPDAHPRPAGRSLALHALVFFATGSACGTAGNAVWVYALRHFDPLLGQGISFELGSFIWAILIGLSSLPYLLIQILVRGIPPKKPFAYGDSVLAGIVYALFVGLPALLGAP